MKRKAQTIKNSSYFIVFGTYEQQLFGYKVTNSLNKKSKTDSNNNISIKFDFMVHPHTGCVKSIAAFWPLMISASTDQSIRIFNIKKGIEIGSLLSHSNTINEVGFFPSNTKKSKFAYSCSDDGMAMVWRTSDWELIFNFGKSGGKKIISSSIHSTGKILCTLCDKDKKLRLWNVISGVQMTSIPLEEYAYRVKWSNSGDILFVAYENKLVGISTKNGKKIMELNSPTKILCFAELNENSIAVSGESKKVTIWNIDLDSSSKKVSDSSIRIEFEGHTNRIREMILIGDHLVTASSDGLIIIWDWNCNDSSSSSSRLATLDTKGQRITSLAVFDQIE